MKFQAWRELMQRYKAVFQHFWSIRHELDGKERNADEAEFLPAVLAVQARPPSPAGRWVARILMILVASILLWSIFGHMDIVVNAQGKVIPSGQTKIISSVETARVKSILVQEGQKVKAGDALLELDTSLIESDANRAQINNQLAQLNAARATALLSSLKTGKPPRMLAITDIPQDKWQEAKLHLEGDWQNYQAKKQQLQAQVSQYQQMLPLMQKQANDYGTLAKTHDVSTHEWQDKQRAYLELQTRLVDAKSQLLTLTAETQKTALDALNEANRIASDASQEQLKAQAHNAMLLLSSPVDGTVQQLQVNTVGASIAAAQPLMQIVPNQDHVEIEAMVENKDIGFIQEGQIVKVKVDAFDYTKYGFLSGKIRNISRDAVSEQKKEADPTRKDANQGLQYAVRIALDQKTLNVNGKEAELTPGMSVRAEVKTGQRRIIEYVLSPLMKYSQESLNER